MIRVMIVDDQPVVRRGFRAFLGAHDDVDVVGEAASGPQALALARTARPDVVLMDLVMPGGDGLAATRALTAETGRRVAVVVVTAFDLDEHVFDALDAGASGLLLKDAEPADLVAAVRTAAGGGAVLSPGVARRVLAEFARRRSAAPHAGAADGAVELTKREREIVCALTRGMSNAEIGRELHLVPGTVKTHLARISAKLGTRDRVQTVVWAFAHGLATPDEAYAASSGGS